MRAAPLTRRMSTVLETPPPVRPGWRPIRKILAANRGEIAIRICRAATEMNIKTVAIYSKEDLGSLHRYKADESFQIGAGKSPVAAYLSAEEIVELAKKEGVDAIHPGYGFLSENTRFVQLCEEAGIIFIGPPSKVIHSFGDKTEARKLAVEYDVPIVPGTETSVSTVAEAAEFCESIGYPVICKAAFGGGGRGMRVVRNAEELGPLFNEASNEAEKAFGDGSMFIERYVDSPRHIEIQILSDGTDVIHLFERDCSVQRRHQKVVEVAPSVGLPADLTQALYADAVRICKGAGYVNAGTCTCVHMHMHTHAHATCNMHAHATCMHAYVYARACTVQCCVCACVACTRVPYARLPYARLPYARLPYARLPYTRLPVWP